jgi:hypothetical protein
VRDDDGIDDDLPPGCVGCGCLLALPVLLACATFAFFILLWFFPLA